VELDGLIADAEACRDRLVRQPFGEELQHFSFARRQRFAGDRRRIDARWCQQERVGGDAGGPGFGDRGELASHLGRRVQLRTKSAALRRRANDEHAH
jgi:hypothetical protein